MRKASAPLLFLIGLLVVVAVAGATAGIASVLDDDTDGTSDDSGLPPIGGDGPAAPSELQPDQVAVTGIATGVTVEGVDFDPIATPLEVTVAADAATRGATLHEIEVDGAITDAVWDGGRPFRLLGAELGIRGRGVNLFASPNTITVGFPDEVVHELIAGSYGLETPVAVGRGGVAVPQDALAFEANVESTVAFRGTATTAMLPRELRFEATTGKVLLTGALEVRRPDGTTVQQTGVELPNGIYTIRFTPRADLSGYDIDALLQGEVLVT